MPRLALVSCCLLLATTTTASAEPPVDSRGYLTLNGSSMLDHAELSFGLGSLEWNRHPSATVDDVMSATLVGAIGLRLGPVPLELGASMPFTITNGGPGMPDSQGVGDAGFHAKVRLARLGRVGVAAIGSVFAPTSAGDHAMSPQLLGVVDANLGRWRLALNGGVRKQTLGMSETVAPVGVALAWALAPEKFELVGEVSGNLGGTQRQMAALGGVKLYLAKNSYLSLGAGRGIATADGTSDFRALIGIVFEPKAAVRAGARIEDDGDPMPRTQVAKNDFPDRDNDGIRDDLDKCPDEPENYNGYQDEDGCPDSDADADKEWLKDEGCRQDDTACKRNRVIVGDSTMTPLRSIEFEYDKAVIRPSSYPILDAVVQAFIDHPDIELVEVRGHTDERGDDAYNMDLSDRRAAAVVEYLTQHGTPAERLTSTGFGETMPLDRRHNEAAWAKNRRVEFQIRKRGGKIM